MSNNQRRNEVNAACQYEQLAFNSAIRNGAKPVLETSFGPYVVTSVSPDFWFTTTANRSFCGCNDGDWSKLLKQAGVERHPLFAKW